MQSLDGTPAPEEGAFRSDTAARRLMDTIMCNGVEPYAYRGDPKP